MRICLVDDDSTQLDYLKMIINKWAGLHNIIVDIDFYHSAEEMLFEHEKSYPFDMILLDIQMNQMNGIELAKKIRSFDQEVFIAFVSGIADYVFEGYLVQAIRYILKPIDEQKIFEILNFVEMNKKSEDKYIIINIPGEKKKINHKDIIFMESVGHYVIFHLEKEVYECKYNISDLLNDLSQSSFIRTHRSYIVNLKHIERINKSSCLLTNNQEIPLSRNAYKLVNEKFIQYYKGLEI